MIGVIGIGNTLRGDDGIGISVLLQLQKKFPGNTNLAFINFGAAGLDLVNIISEYPIVLLIDAVDAGLEAGALRIFRLEEADYKSAYENFSTHELTLPGLFQLYRGLGLSVKVLIAGIQIKKAEYGEGLSPELKERIEDIASEIGSFLGRLEEFNS